LPAENIETAFWLESDRMLSLAFGEKSLEVQRKVVSEEFKEHYLNKPYGDVWHKMRDMAFKVHPYKWMTIGAELGHIEHATLHDVQQFFFKHYTPVNAILVVAGHVTVEQVKQLAEKWFGDIPSGKKYVRTLPQEPLQRTARRLEVHAKVPIDAIYKSWHIYPRLDQRYYITDLLSEILGGGASSRLFQSLVKEKQLFSNIECYHFGTIDAGLLTIDGKLVKGVSMQAAEAAIEEELEKLKAFAIEEKELQKVKNKTESLIAFEDMSLMNRANSLAFYTLLGDASMINDELRRYNSVTPADIKEDAITIFDPGNSNTLYYYAGN
jgi:predicted Zn-dependent peptidase